MISLAKVLLASSPRRQPWHYRRWDRHLVREHVLGEHAIDVAAAVAVDYAEPGVTRLALLVAFLRKDMADALKSGLSAFAPSPLRF